MYIDYCMCIDVFFFLRKRCFCGKRIMYLLLLSSYFCLGVNNTCKAVVVNETQPSYEGKFGMWYVFTTEYNNTKVCYTTSSPIGSDGNYKDNRKPYIMVALFNSAVKREISIVSDYFYKANSVVSVSIDGKQERFIAEDDMVAWPEKNGNDRKIIAEMINGVKMLVFSEEYSGLYSVDTYSLSGFAEAYKKTKELCSI